MSGARETEAKRDPLLADPGHAALLLGNEAIVRGAIEAGVGFASGYPGTPSSEVTDSFARLSPQAGIVFEYSVNEKVALEMAFAASLAGVRSICAMKHLGLMVAGDPLSTIPYMGVNGGMVIVSAGDPSCLTSPNEQDQRYLGPMLHVPVLDPSTPSEAHAMTKLAFELSEASRLPVLMRITTRVAHSRAAVRFGACAERRVAEFRRDPIHMVPIPAHARRLRLEIPGRLEIARGFTEKLVVTAGTGRRVVLACGAPAATCADLIAEHGLEGELTLVRLGGLHPLPEEALRRALAGADEVLVVEELAPFLEDAVAALVGRSGLSVKILGKRSGHLPEPFEYEPAIIAAGLRKAFGLGPSPAEVGAAADLPTRPPVLCPGCPHRSTFFAARAAFPEEQLYFNDIGCYTLGFGPPLQAADALLCMGAGFTLAAGVARVTGKRTVGFLGDSTFFHAGIPALLNAIKEEVNMVAVILDNEVTAMTGFQETPGVEMAAGHAERRVSIAEVARSLGARHVATVDPMNLPEAILAFERARDQQGVSVVVAEHPCPVHVARETGAPPDTGSFEIDHSLCGHCGRDGAGMRCDLCVSPGHERHMARSRALVPAKAWDTCAQEARDEPVAPCAGECPLGLCVQGYAGQIAAGQYAQALELIVSRLPLPDSVCRVCHRPCEEVCVRATVDTPVAINDLKRFVMDWAAAQPEFPYSPTLEPEHGRSVAIVGAGPAGLAAAHELRVRGYSVRIYDRDEEPGGLLRTGIPEFRLPRAVLARDVDRILALGVEFHGGRALGRDIELDVLLEEHDAVFLALGATAPLPLGLSTGAGSPEVVEALAYLDGTKAGAAQPSGAARVVVIGGGNAAIDAARTARRHGALEVVIAYRRGREEMPAIASEIEAAVAEGVDLRTNLLPIAVADGGVRFVRTVPGPADGSGRPRAVPVQGSETSLPAERVILALGQRPDTGSLSLNGHGPVRATDGSIEVDRETAATSVAGLYAGGDLAGGARTVTEAIAWGMRAAWGIDRKLRGEDAADLRPPPPLAATWPHPRTGRTRFWRADVAARQWPPELPAAGRTARFDEVVGGLTEAQARTEAARCAVCGLCGNCRACLDLFGCPAFFMEGGAIEIDPALCTGCGVCADFCPNSAIHPTPAPGPTPGVSGCGSGCDCSGGHRR